MLIQKRFWEPIRSGETTVLFRRWSRLQVGAGRVYRTGAGRLEVTGVRVVDAAGITDLDATRAGYPDVASVLVDLRGRPDNPIYRIEFRYLDEPDPRTVLANSTNLSPGEIAEIDRRLARLDRFSSYGPWTLETLALIESHPERRAPDLAELAGRETAPFKLDVRKLKNLGLTLSFRIGYRLSPRGQAYLGARANGK
jgi:hypothetical protein